MLHTADERAREQQQSFLLLIRTGENSDKWCYERLIVCDNVKMLDVAIETFYNDMRSDRKILLSWDNLQSVQLRQDVTRAERSSEWLLRQIAALKRTSAIWLSTQSLDYVCAHLYVYDMENLEFKTNGLDTVILGCQ